MVFDCWSTWLTKIGKLLEVAICKNLKDSMLFVKIKNTEIVDYLWNAQIQKDPSLFVSTKAPSLLSAVNKNNKLPLQTQKLPLNSSF